MRAPIRAVEGHFTRPTDRETIASKIGSIARTRPAPRSGDDLTGTDSKACIGLGISRHHNSILHASLKHSSMEGRRLMCLVSSYRRRSFTALPSSNSATIGPTSGELVKTLGAASSGMT